MNFTKLVYALLAVLCLSVAAWGQATCYYNVALKDTGRPAPFATVHVGTEESTGTPTSPLAPLFTTEDMTTSLGNPVTADARGNYTFCVANNKFRIQISGSGLTTLTQTDISIPPPPKYYFIDVVSKGAKGDCATDSTAAIQAAIDSLPSYTGNFGHTDFTQSNAQACVLFPPHLAGSCYKTTAPLNVPKSGTCMISTAGPVTIKNFDSGENVINVDSGVATASGILFGIRIENLQLIGTGTASKALYLDQVARSYFRIWSVGHPGTCLYAESNGTGFTGSIFNYYKIDCESNQAAVIGIYSKGGRSNVYEVRTRENEVGIKLENENASIIQNSYIESNNGGTAKVGVQFVDSGAAPGVGSASPRWVNAIENTYFENNTNFSVDADAGNQVILKNIRADGGVDAATDSPTRVFRLNGGGSIDGMWAVQAKVTSSQGIVRARNAWGIYGVHSQLRIEGLNEFPLPYTTTGNTATKSWFDTDPTWTNLGSPNAPTLSFDTGTFFLGSGGSKKAVFPSAATSFADSRTRMDNAITTVVAGDWLGAYAALKFGTGSKLMSLTLRNNGGASETIHDFLFVTDTTDWMVFALQGKVPAGVTSASLFLSAVTEALGVSVDTWTGGVAIAKNAYPVLYNTEWAARGAYDVDSHVLRPSTLIPGNPDPADAGVIRLGNLATIAWEASPTGTDARLSVDANEDLFFEDGNDIAWESGTAFKGILGHANTANRTYTFPDADGNVPALPTAATTETGTGAVVRQTSPSLTTPNIGAATGMSLNLGAATLLDVLTGTASLDFTALAANTCEVLTIAVTGAVDGDAVAGLGIPNALADVDGATERTTFFPWVSGADTVSVRRCNVTGAATAEPAAATVRATVVKF